MGSLALACLCSADRRCRLVGRGADSDGDLRRPPGAVRRQAVAFGQAYLRSRSQSKSGRTVLAVSDVDLSAPPVVVASSSLVDIRSFEWVNDDWLVFNVIDLQAPLRDQRFGPGLFSVRRDGSQMRTLIRQRYDEFTTGTHITSNLLDPSHALMRTLRDGSSDVIVGQYRFDNLGEVMSVTPKRLDVSTGRATDCRAGLPRATPWTGCSTARARPASPRSGTTAGTRCSWRESDSASWRSVLQGEAARGALESVRCRCRWAHLRRGHDPGRRRRDQAAGCRHGQA